MRDNYYYKSFADIERAVRKNANNEINLIRNRLKHQLSKALNEREEIEKSKATLCYFPCCDRNQGVDYTNTELDLQFGRLTDKGIKPIDNNYQSSQSEHFTWEQDARKYYRKWDNIKHIREILKKRNLAKKCYDQGIWGISLKTKERLDKKYGIGIKFGIVITLKEINGINRIDDFIKNCSFRGWLVNRIDVENMIDIYNIAEEDIKFE